MDPKSEHCALLRKTEKFFLVPFLSTLRQFIYVMLNMLCYAKCETLTFSFIGAVLTMMTRAQAQRDSEVSNEISSVLKMNVYIRALLNKVQNFFFFFLEDITSFLHLPRKISSKHANICTC